MKYRLVITIVEEVMEVDEWAGIAYVARDHCEKLIYAASKKIQCSSAFLAGVKALEWAYATAVVKEWSNLI